MLRSMVRTTLPLPCLYSGQTVAPDVLAIVAVLSVELLSNT